jgi:precorrin-6B C5,15-methyltransferase / cobalt-precorrin-6B C5,C15-methyltransferase
MKRWLTIIGTGDDGVAGLAPPALALLDGAEIVVAPPRILETHDFGAAETHPWSSPLSDMVERIAGWRGRQVAILATGDPMHYGIGATMTRHVPLDEMTVIPSPSAFSLAAARLGWALQDVETVSLHGRPVALIEPLIQPGARILALTSGADTVRDVANRLIARGCGGSAMFILEHMGGAGERTVETTAAAASSRDFAEFNTIAIHCIAATDAPILPRVPGLPDDAFRHDGQLTKREVRAITVAALGPVPGGLLWDVGAGCGSVAIEWMRAARGAKAIAFERDPERLSMIADNANALGTPELEIVPGDVPETLAERPVPSAIFVGGAVSDPAVMAACWNALPSGGRLVANAVTLEGENALAAHLGALGGELVRIDVSHAVGIGRKHAMRPRMSVTQWRAAKP